MKNFTCLIFFICSTLFSQSKSNLTKESYKFPQERIAVHYNNELLVTGEKLYYKIYCFDQNKQFSNYSKIAYIELRSSENKTITKHKVSLDSGTGYGDFFINAKVKTGAYKLICYTKWMKNYGNYFENTVFIVNPFADKITTKSNIEIIPEIRDNFNLNNKISTNKRNYSKREKVSLSLNKIDFLASSNLSISVKKQENFKLPFSNTEMSKLNVNPNSNLIFLPELRGNILKGRIESVKNKTVANKPISLSINHEHLPLIATTNNVGEFYFNILNLNSNKVYLQILDTNATEYQIKLLPDEDVRKEINIDTSIQLTQNTINTIKARSIYTQIENAYYKVKKDSIRPLKYKDSLFSSRKNTYILDDYKRFKSLKETFVEIITSAKIRTIDQKQRIIAPSEDIKTTGFIGNIPSLLIVDGHIIHDHDSFMNFDCSKINTIAVVNDKYCYGNSIYQGITFIDTFKKDYTPISSAVKEFKVIQVQPKKEYFFENYTTSKKRIPDYRTQLYWNPNVSEKEIDFYTSDVTGNYEVIVKGYTKKGKPIIFNTIFSVQ
ncbi:hypothetical protein [uncultured Tenacibaculum sp.]|uniref:hypothetical protein n=1 Tax=uncultured Tenacibaculum sp. TaxID=174713 RepID=UPI0026022917|nr:hypothetical protein [uncultured Tenacibaculum sp.]